MAATTRVEDKASDIPEKLYEIFRQGLSNATVKNALFIIKKKFFLSICSFEHFDFGKNKNII